MTISQADRRLLTALNTQWRALDSERGAVRAWTKRWEAFAGRTTLGDCVVRPFGRSDGCLFALLQATREGDEVAGRTVLQSLLPAMVRMAGRDAGADLGDYLAQLWCRIRTYPLERRPSRVASNLELDTLKAVCRDRPRVRVVPADTEDLERVRVLRERPGEAFEPTARAVIGAARARGLIDEYTSRVLHTVYADGLSGREAAERHHTSVDLIRWRCSKAVRTLARHAGELAEVA